MLATNSFFFTGFEFSITACKFEFSITGNEENEEQKKKKCKMHTSTTSLWIPEKDLDLLKSMKHLQVEPSAKQTNKQKRQNKTKSHICYVKGIASGTILQFCCLEH